MARHALAALAACALLAAGACSRPASESAAAGPAGKASAGTPAVTLFEGARLITGEGGAPIENSAFLVEGNTFTRVGRRGDVPLPEGASRVDLTGRTVMPRSSTRTATSVTGAARASRRGTTRARTSSITCSGWPTTRVRGHEHGSRAPRRARAARRAQGSTTAGHSPLPLRGRGIAMPDGGPAPPLRDAPYGVSMKPRRGKPCANCTPGRSITTSRSGWTIAAAR